MTYHDISATQEQRYDHYDDVGEHDAATIRAMTGLETNGTNTDFTVDAITTRAGGELALKGMGIEFWQKQNQKGGFNHQELAGNTPEQKAINAEGYAKLRAAITASKEAK